MSESVFIHTPNATAPQVSGKVAHCNVCNIQWQIRSLQAPYDDAQGCGFCGAPKSSIHIEDESDRRA